MGSLRVGHDWATSLSLFTFMLWRRKWQPAPVFLLGESQGRETWWAAVYGVAQSRTWLKRLSSSSSIFVGTIYVTSKCFLVCHGIHPPHFTYPLPTNSTTINRVVITIFVLIYVCACLILLLFSLSVVSDSLWPHGLQHARLPCPSPSPGACSNSCPSNQWCYPTILSSVVPFSSCLQSFPASGSFPMSWLFTSRGQSIGASASASVLPMNIQGWCLLGLSGLISLQSKGLSRVFSNTTVQKH